MADPISTIGAIAATLQIVDSLTGQWDRVFRRKPEEDIAKQHRVNAAQISADTISVSSSGIPTDTITADDLTKLSENDRALIQALEKSMQRQYELWLAVYPSRNASPDALVNAHVEQQLKEIARNMCSDLGKIFQYIDFLGKHLEDHYSNFRFICWEIEQAKGVSVSRVPGTD